MKSIKPGRGPSMFRGVMSIFLGLFGLFWTIMALTLGAGPFALFGLIFIGIAVYSAIYNFKNATSENRHSTYDIVDSEEEPDPFNERFGRPSTPDTDGTNTSYCPYCGIKVEEKYEYCAKCGKKLP